MSGLTHTDITYMPVSSENWLKVLINDYICGGSKVRSTRHLQKKNGSSQLPIRSSFLECWHNVFFILTSQCSFTMLSKITIHNASQFPVPVILYAPLCCCWLGQLRGSLWEPGYEATEGLHSWYTLNWINPKLISGSLGYKLEPPINVQNWISLARLDHAFYLNKYSIKYCLHVILLYKVFLQWNLSVIVSVEDNRYAHWPHPVCILQ